MRTAGFVALPILLLAAAPVESASLEDSLKGFLQTYLKSPPWTEADPTTRYLHALVDLDGDGMPDAIVYITGRTWCGSGGCTTLVLRREGSSFKLVTRIPITRPPIRVMQATSHGWHGISVWAAGGGIRPGYEAQLRFDGKTYSWNPTALPARRLDQKSEGELVINGSEDAPLLYP